MVLLYAHARRTGWKIRPRPKSVLLKIKKKKMIQMMQMYCSLAFARLSTP